MGIAVDVAKASTPRSSDSGPIAISPHADTMTDKNKSGDKIVSHSPKTNTTVGLSESMTSKQHPVRPFVAVGSPFLVNRYKLDNRPTAFTILPPLPAGFTNVSFFSPPSMALYRHSCLCGLHNLLFQLHPYILGLSCYSYL